MSIYNISKYKKDKEDHIDDFEQDSGIEVIDQDVKSLGELEDEHDDFQQMTYKQRKVSNAKSEEVYGKNNIERYEDIKSKLLKTNKNDDTSIVIQGESNIILQSDDTKDILEPVSNYYDKIDIADKWSHVSMISIITPRATIQELEELWNTWNMMHLKHRRDSDNKSNELFSMTNKEHYESLKTTFLRQDKGIVDIEPNSHDISISTNESTILTIRESLNKCTSNIEATTLLMKLNSIGTDSIYDESMIKKITEDTEIRFNNNVNTFFDKLTNMPYFLPDEMEELGIHCDDGYYSNVSDNKYIDEDNLVSTKDWLYNYKACMSGFVKDDYRLGVSLWINTLNNLYRDYNEIKESMDFSRINSRKQSILELGWNPEIEFSLDNRKRVTERTIGKLKSLNDKCIYNIDEFYNNVEPIHYINESASSESKSPLFIVLSFSNNLFSKTVKKFTNAMYSHSSIGLDVELDRLYSYDIRENGFSVESLDKYKKINKDSNIAVYVTFLTKEEIRKVKIKLDYFLANMKDTSYSYLNLLGITLGKDVEKNNDMICSQFVDRMLKMLNMDITNKPSGLVAPNDFYITNNSNMYQIYEGPITKYNVAKTRSLISKLQKNNSVLKENNIECLSENSFIETINENVFNIDTLIQLNEHSNLLCDKNKAIYETVLKPYIDIYYYNEAKEFPVQFDKEGNLLVSNMKNIDIEEEYRKTHKLLKIYEGNDNSEGMKYEISKLWFLNNILEKEIYSSRTVGNKKTSLYKVRARILNDFNKYLKIITVKEENFNFTDYYNKTPFSDATIKINSSTLKHGGKLITTLSKLLV